MKSRNTGGDAVAVVGDVGNAEDSQKMVQAALDNWDRLEKSMPLGFIGDPEDVVHMVKAFVAEEGRFITGQTVHVDGGMAVGLRM